MLRALLPSVTLLLAACSGPRSDDLVGMQGALSYRERIALSPGATYAVRVVALEGEERRLVAGFNNTTAAQVPIPFQLNWRRGDAGRAPLQLEAEIVDGARRWILPTPVEIDPAGSAEILGLSLVLAR